jgi:hypothetical protein
MLAFRYLLFVPSKQIAKLSNLTNLLRHFIILHKSSNTLVDFILHLGEKKTIKEIIPKNVFYK